MLEGQLSKNEAARLLAPVPAEKAFYFYGALGQPLDRSSKSLAEFADVVKEVDVSSVKFHLDRGDFENWFKMLGDPVLSRQVAALRDKEGPAGELGGKVSAEVRSRVNQLQQIARARPKPRSLSAKRRR